MNKTNETEGLTPTLVERFTQMGSAMISCHDTFTGKPVGAWIKANDYDQLQRELSASSLRIEEMEKELREARANEATGSMRSQAIAWKAVWEAIPTATKEKGTDNGMMIAVKVIRAAESAESRVAHLEGVIRELVRLSETTYANTYTWRQAWTAARQSLKQDYQGGAEGR